MPLKRKKPARAGEEETEEEKVEDPALQEAAPEARETLLDSEQSGETESEEVDQLRKEIETTELDDTLKVSAFNQAQSIKALDDEKKIKKLLELVKTKGIVYAVNVAQKMNDPYILDQLHDLLVKEGYYKNATK